ncbi:hypothetical protein P8452_29686 [Trifolium repens]|nr:hypothetical protein P8452_29686 [Trifolium repens]
MCNWEISISLIKKKHSFRILLTVPLSTHSPSFVSHVRIFCFLYLYSFTTLFTFHSLCSCSFQDYKSYLFMSEWCGSENLDTISWLS